MNRTARILATIILILFVAAIGWSLVSYLSHHGKAKINLIVIPPDSTVTVDGRPSNPGNIYLKPGSHTFVAAKAGFTNAKKILQTKKGEKQTVYLLPAPSSPEAIQYLQDNPTIQAQREAYGSLQDSTITEDTVAKSPIIKHLPITDIYGPFSIDYGASPDKKNGTYLTITDSSPNGRVKALQWIREQGTDPTSLEIQFSDFDNPLIKIGGNN